MHRSLALTTSLSLLSLATTAAAQSYATIPGGLLTAESSSYSLYFGSRDSMRAQIFNNEHNAQVRVFGEASFRLDGGRSGSSYFAGRTWSNVQLTVDEVAYASASPTFAANLSTNAKVVFNQQMSWPTYSGATNSPHTWATEVNMPFSSTWLYTGTQDIVLDFQFSGGTLANNAAWTGYSTYYLDGVYSTTSVGGGSVNVGTNNCLNSPHTSGPFCVPVLRTYAKNSGNPTTDDKFEFYWWLYRYPANTLTAFGVSLTGSKTGVDIGNPCNFYYLGPSIFVVLLGTTPATNSGSFNFPSQKLYTPYVPAAVGLTLYTQAAYTEPTRNQFELTRAGYADFLAQPIVLQGTQWTWAAPVTATSGGSLNQTYMPVVRMKY
ncbi:MAG: hypothetical protein KDC87_05005 [Planctomycetes bacterium]|nr:hypothetical protein [Planctomycetota bacterium]MCB9869750.1 hypothetical protein [Planctomycetota bacterium]